MYEIMNIKEEIEINGVRIRIKEYKGYNVLTFKDIDGVHGRKSGTARKRFYDNKERFIEGVDYFKVKCSEVSPFFGQTPQNGYNPHADLILLTESGYLMLVKSFTDELSWKVQRQLITGYFRAVQMQKEEIQKKDAEEEEDKYSNFSISSIVGGVKFLFEEKTLLEQQMKNENYKLEQQMKSLNEKINILIEENQVYYEDIYFLKEEIKILNKENEKLKEKNREFNQICKRNQAKIKFLKEDVKELKNENKKLNEKIEKLNREFDTIIKIVWERLPKRCERKK